jgi:hypothetical protein
MVEAQQNPFRLAQRFNAEVASRRSSRFNVMGISHGDCVRDSFRFF